MKVILIAGEPATGKTTLVCKAFEPEKMPHRFAFGRLRGHSNGQIFVGGIYDGSLFQGTDKLSMSVQPDVVSFVHNRSNATALSSEGKLACVLVMEGDRVANAKFLAAMKDIPVQTHLIILRAPYEELEARHKSRGDQQTEKWLASRRTKVENLCEAARQMPHVTLHEWVNESLHGCGVHASALRAIITT